MLCSVDHTLTLVVTPCILGGVGGIGAGSPGCIWPVSPRTRKFRSVACVHALVSLSLVLVSCPARWVPMVLPPTRLDMLVMGRAPRLAILLEGTARHTLLLPCIRRDMEVLLPTATRAVTRCTQRPRLRQGLVGCSVQLFPSHVQKSLRCAEVAPPCSDVLVSVSGGYGGYGGYASTVPTGGSMGPPGAGDAPGVAGTSYKVPRGARYIGAEKETRDGKEVIIDRYAVPQRHVQQV